MELDAEVAPGAEHLIVFMSGGTFRAGLEDFVRDAGNRYLLKPFMLEAALDAIRGVTDRSSGDR